MFNFKKVLVISAIVFLISVLTTNFASAQIVRVGVVTAKTKISIRITPKTTSKVLLTVSKGKRISVLKKSGSWFNVSYSGKTGWALSKYVKIVPIGTGTVKVKSGANLRSKPSVNSKSKKLLDYGDKVTVLYTSGKWYGVRTLCDKYGYIRKDLLSVRKGVVSRSSDREDDLRRRVVAYAKKFLGCRYSYSGASPSGFDCRGFTHYVYKHFGITLSLGNANDQSKQGRYVSKRNLKPGDLIFFGYNGYVNHASLYIGNNKIIHASTYSTGVIISDLDLGYYNSTYIKAKRVIG